MQLIGIFAMQEEGRWELARGILSLQIPVVPEDMNQLIFRQWLLWRKLKNPIISCSCYIVCAAWDVARSTLDQFAHAKLKAPP